MQGTHLLVYYCLLLRRALKMYFVSLDSSKTLNNVESKFMNI